MAAEDHAARSFECKAYYSLSGIGGTPTWVEMPEVQNLSLTPNMDESDTTIRGVGGAKLSEPTLLAIALEFNMPYIRGSSTRTQLVTSFFARSKLGIAVMDQAITASGADGVAADMKVFSIPRQEDIDKTVDQKFTLKPCIPSQANGTYNSPVRLQVA